MILVGRRGEASPAAGRAAPVGRASGGRPCGTSRTSIRRPAGTPPGRVRRWAAPGAAMKDPSRRPAGSPHPGASPRNISRGAVSAFGRAGDAVGRTRCIYGTDGLRAHRPAGPRPVRFPESRIPDGWRTGNGLGWSGGNAPRGAECFLGGRARRLDPADHPRSCGQTSQPAARPRGGARISIIE